MFKILGRVIKWWVNLNRQLIGWYKEDTEKGELGTAFGDSAALLFINCGLMAFLIGIWAALHYVTCWIILGYIIGCIIALKIFHKSLIYFYTHLPNLDIVREKLNKLNKLLSKD